MSENNFGDLDIYYDDVVEITPNLLEDDWNIRFKNDNEKNLIKTYLLLNNSKESVKNKFMQKALGNELDEVYNKGFFNATISFSFNKSKRDYVILFLSVYDCLCKSSNCSLAAEDVLGFILAFESSFFKFLKVIKKAEERCIFNEIVIMCGNNPNVAFTNSKIFKVFEKREKIYQDEGFFCPNSDDFSCERRNHNCKISDEEIFEILASFEKNKILRKDGENYYIMW